MSTKKETKNNIDIETVMGPLDERKTKILSYDFNDDEIFDLSYTGDGSFESFLCESMCLPIDTFYVAEEWIAHFLGLSEIQKKGLYIFKKMLWEGEVDFELFFNYDFHKFNTKQKSFIAKLLNTATRGNESLSVSCFVVDDFVKNNLVSFDA